MTNHQQETQNDVSRPASTANSIPQSFASTWVTWLACTVCVGIWIGLTISEDVDRWATLAKFGYLPAKSIWEGHYWALITSSFVHIELWHLAFNVYWLWTLGNRLERAVGSLRFLAFVLAAAFVSSAYQLAISDTTGHGASGIGYAEFGFMWVARNRYPLFQEVLDRQTIRLFMIWLFGCIVATLLDVWQVGNAAHVSGLLFGVLVAAAFVRPIQQRPMRIVLAVMVALSITVLVWCPWSVTWLSQQAFKAHVAEHYDKAIDLYTQIIHRDPRNSWAFLNRSYAYQALGQNDEAQADLKTARQLDPRIEQEQED